MRRLRPPFRSFVLDTDRSPEQVVARLAANLDPDREGFFKAPGQREWIGFARTDGMELRRRTMFRNSFLPMVRARFEKKGKGTRLHVTMSLMLLTRLLLGVWVLLAATAMVGLAMTGQLIMLLVPLMLVAVYAMCAFAFHLEGDLAEQYLRGLFEPRAKTNDAGIG